MMTEERREMRRAARDTKSERREMKKVTWKMRGEKREGRREERRVSRWRKRQKEGGKYDVA